MSEIAAQVAFYTIVGFCYNLGMTSSKWLRAEFLNYFQGLDHLILPSSSLIPKEDPTLLFSNAGMNQFKPIFLGAQKAPHHSVVTCQKCLRISGKHNDLDNIGLTRRHHTFFEMLGNFSFGGYFKKEAIEYAWRFVTEILSLDRDRLVVTYFKDDAETARLWGEIAGLESSRIIPLGESDNFWSMGDTGPCGPCSEIHYFTGSSAHLNEPELFQNRQSEFLEIWNLVFMEFNKTESGFESLSVKCIDTGMGLERVCAILQNVASNFETDLLRPIIQAIEDVSGVAYQPRGFIDELDVDDHVRRINTAFRIVADHARAISFLISEGLLPGSDERQYVLRKLIRRATLFSKKISDKRILPRACAAVVEIFREVYPEIDRSSALIDTVVSAEMERFNEILEDGLRYLNSHLEGSLISGETAFTLHDTYGFPIEVTRDIAKEQGLVIDEAGFGRLMLEQRERSRATGKNIYIGIQSDSLQTEFVGYSTLEAAARLIGAQKSDKDIWIVTTNLTPFYSESGGQVGDRGELHLGGEVFQVIDTQRLDTGAVAHYVKTTADLKKYVGSDVRLRVDPEFRRACCRAHSATHLIHHALRSVLGPETKQAGSKVEPDRLRFDFTCFSELQGDALKEILKIVEALSYANHKTEIFNTTLNEALSRGALAFFADKYKPENVRVVKIGDSIELCGGTHAESSSEILPVRILKCHSVSTGIKRLEVLVGKAALADYMDLAQEKEQVLVLLKSKDKLIDSVKKLKNELESRQAWSNKLEDSLVALMVSTRFDSMFEGSSAVVFEIEDQFELLAEKICDYLKSRFDKICYVIVKKQPNASVVVGTNNPNLNAHDHLRQVLTTIGGKGGGNSRFAKAVIPSDKVDEAVQRATSV